MEQSRVHASTKFAQKTFLALPPSLPASSSMELTAIAARPAEATRDVAFDDPGQDPIRSAATAETKGSGVGGGEVRGWADRSGKTWYVGASQRGLPPHEQWDAGEAEMSAGRYIGGDAAVAISTQSDDNDDTAARRPNATPPAREAQQLPYRSPPPVIGIARQVCASMLVVVIMAFAALTIFSEIIYSPTFESQMVAIAATAAEVVQLEVRMWGDPCTRKRIARAWVSRLTYTITILSN